MQEQAIQKYANEKRLEIILYVEKISSRKVERQELEHAMKAATVADVFVVYKLDRLARSTKELFRTGCSRLWQLRIFTGLEDEEDESKRSVDEEVQNLKIEIEAFQKNSF